MSRAPLVLAVAAVVILGALGWIAHVFLRADPPQVEPGRGAAGMTARNEEAPLPAVAPVDGGAVAAAPTRTVERTEEARPTAPAPAEPQGPSGSIVGRVLDQSDQPVPATDVELMRGPTMAARTRALMMATGHKVETDAFGAYRFESVEPHDDYIVAASHAEFGSSEIGPVVVSDRKEVRVGDLKLTAGAHVEGLVTSNGRPVQDAVVTLANSMDRIRRLQPDVFRGRDGDAGFAPFEIGTRTDGAGHYEFSSVPIDSFEITAFAVGLARVSKTSQASLFGGSSRDHRIDFELTPGLKILGRVVDEAHNGIEGTTVEATIASQSFRCEGETMSDDGGRFELEGLAPGQYFLAVSREGYSSGNRAQVEAGTIDLEIVLRVQGGVSGIVVDEATGTPIPAFRLDVLQSFKGRGPVIAKERLPFQDSSGRFEIVGLDPGVYSIQGRAKGYADSCSDEFEVARGETTPSVRVALNQGGGVTGTVVDGRGKPVRGAQVILRDNGTVDNPLRDALGRFADGGPEKKGKSKADGSFRIELVVPGTYQVAVRHPDFAPFERDDVEVTKGETRPIGALELLVGGRISGHAYDFDGKPLVSAAVVAVRADGLYRRVLSSNEGFYEVTTLPAGDYTVSINSFQTDPPINSLQSLVYARNSQQKRQLVDGDDLTVDLRLTRQK